MSRRRVATAAAAALAALAARRAGAQVTLPLPAEDVTGRMCGGLIGGACPPGYACVEDPNDGCDPAMGGADCPGVCMRQAWDPCAATTCMAGTYCCSGGTGVRCIPVDEPCISFPPEEPQGIACGPSICGPGEYCCNESCGYCRAEGEGCTREYCSWNDPAPGPVTGEQCGPNVCAPGEVCCNRSCGICTPPDGACIALFCG